MRIGILSEHYPPAETDHLAQRLIVVANEIAQRGHDVHILAIGEKNTVQNNNGLYIHAFMPYSTNSYSPQVPKLDSMLTKSQTLYEGLLQCATDQPFDVIDIPFDSLVGLITLQHYRGLYVFSALHPTKDRYSDKVPGTVLEIKLKANIRQIFYDSGRAVFTYYSDDYETTAERVLEVYERAITADIPAPKKAQKVYQVMEALDYGDAVSNIARRNAGLLAEMGQPSAVLARFSHPSLQRETAPIRQALSDLDCGLIFHYWGFNYSTWVLSAVRGPKAIHYHNVTPSHYFPPDSELCHSTTQARCQLRQIADSFDLIIAVSKFNLNDFSQYLSGPKHAIVLYPVVDAAELKNVPYDHNFLENLRHSDTTHFLFVGRVARNKRQDLLMRTFDYYWCNINRYARLWLVGNDQVDGDYRAQLEALRLSLPSGNHIVFTGKVSDAELYAYYRAAHAFICASEHEGFCMPLAQAMVFDMPVLAYAAAAVPETMGGSGLLIHEWDIERVAELMHLAINDKTMCEALCDRQRDNVARFSLQESQQQLRKIVGSLSDNNVNLIGDKSQFLEIDHTCEDSCQGM